jgi:hypothetical protein
LRAHTEALVLTGGLKDTRFYNCSRLRAYIGGSVAKIRGGSKNIFQNLSAFTGGLVFALKLISSQKLKASTGGPVETRGPVLR